MYADHSGLVRLSTEAIRNDLFRCEIDRAKVGIVADKFF